MLLAMRRIAITVLALGLSTFGAVEARADVAPANTCTGPGQSCANAPPDYKTAGTCKASTCYRSLPAPDGGRQSMPYDCTLCEASNGNAGAGGGGAGAAGSAGTGAGGAGTAGSAGAGGGTAAGGASAAGSAGATSAASNDESGCNCVVSPARGGSVMAGLMLAAGAVALFFERRARRG
jgi:hypothetical protein